MNQRERDEHAAIIDAWRMEEDGTPLICGGQGRTDSEVEEQSGLIVGVTVLVGAAALAGFLVGLVIGAAA